MRAAGRGCLQLQFPHAEELARKLWTELCGENSICRYGIAFDYFRTKSDAVIRVDA